MEYVDSNNVARSLVVAYRVIPTELATRDLLYSAISCIAPQCRGRPACLPYEAALTVSSRRNVVTRDLLYSAMLVLSHCVGASRRVCPMKPRASRVISTEGSDERSLVFRDY